MEMREESLRQRYRAMETSELIELVRAGTLTETAGVIIDEELNGRGVAGESRVRLVEDAEREQRQLTEPGLASRGSRFAGQLIDSAIALALLLIPISLFTPNEYVGMASVIAFLGYLLLADALPNGQSIGKRMLGTAVVDQRTRRPCGIGQSLVRNALGVLGIIDWLFIFGRLNQRLGDKAARTIVVNARRRTAG
jgi:uncharacterized RDD family membrane protein YckC